jgi:MAP/microtubule affinity-regulating kinase
MLPSFTTSERSTYCEGLSLSEASSPYEEILTVQYNITETLGRGSFGKVKLASHRLTGAQVAVKVLDKGEKNPHTDSEVSVMKALEHPNIVRLYQVIETAEHVYLIMERAGKGHLLHLIQRVHHLREDHAQKMFSQIAHAVLYCHENGIAHRDLKPHNILLDAKGDAKITEFGLSVKFEEGQQFSEACGAIHFRAPEMLFHKNYEGPKVDVWSLGVLLYYINTGAFPFLGRTFVQLQRAVMLKRYFVPYHLSAEGQDAIDQLLTVLPSERPPVDKILQHPWLSQSEEIPPSPGATLGKQPRSRILQVMSHLGFNFQETQESLANKKFDEAMATYQMLQEQVCQDVGGSTHPRPSLYQRAPPCPSPVDPLSVHGPLQKRASEPNLSSLIEQQSDDKKPSQRNVRGTILLSLSLSDLPRDTLTPLTAFQLGPKTLTSEKEDTKKVPEATVTDRQRRGWKAVTRRIMTSLLNLCCCVPLSKKRQKASNRVVPKAQVDTQQRRKAHK